MAFLETAVVAAVMTFTNAANVFTFDAPDAHPKDVLVAFVQHHSEIGEFPQQPGWIKVGEVSTTGGGPRVAAYVKRKGWETPSYIFHSNCASALDIRAEGVLVVLRGVANKISLPIKGDFVFNQGYFDDYQQFTYNTEVQISTKIGETVVWFPFDNTLQMNMGKAAFTQPLSQTPSFEATSTTSMLAYCNERDGAIGPNTGHPIITAGIWLRLKDAKAGSLVNTF